MQTRHNNVLLSNFVVTLTNNTDLVLFTEIQNVRFSKFADWQLRKERLRHWLQLLFIETKQVFIVHFGIILFFIVLVLDQCLSGKNHPFCFIRIVILVSVDPHALNHVGDLLILYVC